MVLPDMTTTFSSSEVESIVSTSLERYELYLKKNTECGEDLLAILKGEALTLARTAMRNCGQAKKKAEKLLSGCEVMQEGVPAAKTAEFIDATPETLDKNEEPGRDLQVETTAEVLSKFKKPEGWDAIIGNLAQKRDTLWRMLLGASAFEAGASIDDAAEAIGMLSKSFKENYSRRVALLSEVVSSFALPSFTFYHLFEITQIISEAKESDCDFEFLDAIRRRLDAITGGSNSRKVRFRLMEHTSLQKMGKSKSWFPFVSGKSGGNDGQRFLSGTRRPLLLPGPLKMFCSGITPRQQIILEDDLVLPRGISHYSPVGSSLDSVFYPEVHTHETRLMERLEERGTVTKIVYFSAGPPFTEQ